MSGVQFRAAELRAARQRAGLSQAELAAGVGVFDGARVRSWERGAEQPSVSRVSRLALALGIDPLEMYEGDPARPPLALLRRIAGLTLKELAQTTGLSYARCQRLEQGQIEATHDDLIRLASALNVSVAQLPRPAPLAASESGDQEPDRQGRPVGESRATIMLAGEGPNSLAGRENGESRDTDGQRPVRGVPKAQSTQDAQPHVT